jgi:hypothetical protein
MPTKTKTKAGTHKARGSSRVKRTMKGGGGWFGGKSGKHNIAKHNAHKQYLSNAKNKLINAISIARNNYREKGFRVANITPGKFISSPQETLKLPYTNMQIQARLQPMGDHFQKTSTINNVVKEWQTLQNKAKAEEVEAERIKKAKNNMEKWKNYLNYGGQ